MGKHKQAQRTKNNARPSNSSRSAALLGSAMPNFVGFSAVKEGGYVPVLPGLAICNSNEVEMSNVDTNFQIVLKKMHKKDVTTKWKALQEFATLCQESELSAVKGMLPFWPRLYSALVIDIEHKVREAAQLAHAAVVRRVGKGIAMYLKQLAGPWFTSQYDTYAPAASAATNSFNETFPQNKIVDAVIHCQHEILSYICDNITVHTPQSLSVQKNLTAEEMETKYQKVLYSNLQGYSFYFKKVPSCEIQNTIEIHHKITNSSRFWKLAKHEAFFIKTAFFNVLTSIIVASEDVLENDKKKMVTAIMNSLDETEPALLSAVWESMLITVTKIEDWHLVVNVEKLVLPKLWRVLRSGGQSCASIIYPNLLPLISQLAKLNIGTNNLYMSFFDNMRRGFTVKGVQVNRSETFAMSVSFVECLQYSILQNVNDTELCMNLLKQQLTPVIEMCMVENLPIKNVLFSEIAQLIRYWCRNQSKEEYKLYSDLLQEFWTELKALFDKLINETQNIHHSCSLNEYNPQIEFLLTLRNGRSNSRKNLKVKFSNTNEVAKALPEPEIKNIEVNGDTEFYNQLINFVSMLCIAYFKQVNVNHCDTYIKHLSKLITHFENKALFVALLKAYAEDADFHNFYAEILRNWLFKKSEDIEHVVDITFGLIKYMDDSDKDRTLLSLLEFQETLLLRTIIQCGLSRRNRNDASIKKWCSQSKITHSLIEVAKEIISEDYNDLFNKNKTLILLAFESDEDGNILINIEGFNEIADILCSSLNDNYESPMKDVSELILQLLPLTWTYRQSTVGATQMLETIFKLCIYSDCNNDDVVSSDTMRTVWREGLLKNNVKLSHCEFIKLTIKLASIMWQKVNSSPEVHDKDILIHIATDFIENIIKNEDSTNADHIKDIVLAFLVESNIQESITQMTHTVIYGEIISGNLYVANPHLSTWGLQKAVPIDVNTDILEDSITTCLIWALFNTSLLESFHLRLPSNSNFSKERDNPTYQIDNIAFPGVRDILTNIIYVTTLGNIYEKHYKSTKQYGNAKKLLVSLKANIINLISRQGYKEILCDIQMKYADYGTMLPYVVLFYCTELNLKEDPVNYFANCIPNEIYSNNNKEICLQGFQVLCRYQKSEEINFSIEDNVSALIISRTVFIRQDNLSMCIAVLEKIIFLQKEDSTLLLSDCNISDVAWEKIILPLEVIRFITELVKTVPTKLTSEHWDFILVSLTLWQLSVNKSKQDFTKFQVTAFIVAVSQLYSTVQNLLHMSKMPCIENLPPTLLDEWSNVFVNDISTGIIQTWMTYADVCNQQMILLKPIITLNYLGKALSVVDGKTLFKINSDNVDKVSVDLDSTILLSLKLLQSSLPSIQLGAYHVLKHAISELVARDTVLMESGKFNSNLLNMRRLEEVLINVQNIVNTILADFKLCDSVSCSIEPFTDSYTYTLAYFFVWMIILGMIQTCEHQDLQYQYAEMLKENYLPCLLNNIFRLMPAEVYDENKRKVIDMGLFSTVPSINFAESWTESRLGHMVCSLYVNSLRHLPVLVRQWWSTTDSRISAAVDKITTNYISPMLCLEELPPEPPIRFANMQVRVRATARELVALYHVDDTKLQLRIVLAPNHPLGTITIEADEHAGAATNWKYCHMQLSIFLVHHNGSVWDGIFMWKDILDKKFAGVEECYICFSIFHISTYQIPKLSCHTCRKKFHTPCLYKWFNTSQKSTCPICRNIF